MDDFVLATRQIAQFAHATPQPGDQVVFQQGGLGGPYASCAVNELIAAAFFGSAPITSAGIISAASFHAPNGGSFYWDSGSLSVTALGGLSFNYIIAAGAAEQLLELDPAGDMTLPRGTLTVARSPINNNDVATKIWTELNTVWSFNGRTGPIALSSSDLSSALGLAAGDAIASQAWVNATICSSLQSWYTVAPLVFTFNGRVGDIMLGVADVNNALLTPASVFPRSITPPLGDASTRIATTLFVDDSINDAITGAQGNIQEVIDYVNANFAPINSPNFTGIPTAPSPPPASATGQIATTAFVMNAIAQATAGVASFNGRTGIVTLELVDLTDVGVWDYAQLTGVPTAPTAAVGTQTNQLATTAFVLNEVAAISAGVVSFNTRTGTVTLQLADVTGVGGAPIASPNFSGTPQAPTAAPGTSTNQIATTAFVAANAGVLSFMSRTGAITLLGNDISAAGGALIASPIFTGTPQAPTAPGGTANTQLATTAFVANAVGSLAGFLPLTGGTLSGTLTITAPATLQAAGGVFVGNSGLYRTSTGNFTIGQSGVGGLQYIPGTGWQIINAGQTNNPIVFNENGTISCQTLAAASAVTANTLTSNGNTNVNGALTVQGSASLQGQTSAANLIAGGNGVNYGLTGTVFAFGFDGYGETIVMNGGNRGYIARGQGDGVTTAGVYQFWSNGSLLGVAWPGNSGNIAFTGCDARLKSNVEDSGDALPTLMALQVHEFDYTTPGFNAPPVHWPFGLIAQEVEPLLPPAYIPPPTAPPPPPPTPGQREGEPPVGYAGLHDLPLVALLVKAVQQLVARIEALEAAA
jgi:hypothetical protein